VLFFQALGNHLILGNFPQDEIDSGFPTPDSGIPQQSASHGERITSSSKSGVFCHDKRPLAPGGRRTPCKAPPCQTAESTVKEVMSERDKTFKTIIDRPRRRRFPYGVKVSVPFSPFKILHHLQGVNLSEAGVLSYASLEADRAKFPLEALLAEGDLCEIQLEHPFEQLEIPYLKAHLVRKHKHVIGTEFAFAFAPENQPDIVELWRALER
jgi:hypothetical protein